MSHHARRRFLGIMGAGSLSAVVGTLVGERLAVSSKPIVTVTPTLTPAPLAEIDQPANPTPAAFMERAVAMRRIALESGDQAYGAIIVRDNRIVGLGPSRVLINSDPTAHAEMEAVRDACRRLGTRDLSGCAIYATSRPCRMCETACYWAGVSTIYFGAGITDAGAPRYCSC